MEHMGVTKALRDVILMSEYENLRYTQSIEQRVIGAFEMRCGSLESVTEE